MKLLLDENVSYRVLKIIRARFPDSVHTSELSSIHWDSMIFFYAKENGFTIVTFDEDFYELQLLKGFPPKIVWLRFGNSSNLKIANKLLDNYQKIKQMTVDSDLGLLEIY
jgi:predicted nuclease of predicted toxin-antitoxin system